MKAINHPNGCVGNHCPKCGNCIMAGYDGKCFRCNPPFKLENLKDKAQNKEREA